MFDVENGTLIHGDVFVGFDCKSKMKSKAQKYTQVPTTRTRIWVNLSLIGAIFIFAVLKGQGGSYPLKPYFDLYSTLIIR